VRVILWLLFIFCCRHDRLLKEVTIALVGKYTKLEDAYASVLKALNHAAMAVNHKLNIKVCEGCRRGSIHFTSTSLKHRFSCSLKVKAHASP
jgi:CTP synthase (UTP-ammonia lyase)